MKFFHFSLVLILLASCGMTKQHRHLKLIKVGHTESAVLVNESSCSTEKNGNESSILIVNETVVATSEENQFESVGLISKQPQKEQFTQKVKDLEPEESEEAANERIIKQAIKAEKDAKTALILFGAGAISLIVPYIGIFFFTVGLLFYSKAKSSRYITPFGNERLDMSRGIMIFDSIVLTLWLLLIVLIFLAFLL
jgi:hypothetical protein